MRFSISLICSMHLIRPSFNKNWRYAYVCLNIPPSWYGELRSLLHSYAAQHLLMLETTVRNAVSIRKSCTSVWQNSDWFFLESRTAIACPMSCLSTTEARLSWIGSRSTIPLHSLHPNVSWSIIIACMGFYTKTLSSVTFQRHVSPGISASLAGRSLSLLPGFFTKATLIYCPAILH